MSKFRPCIDLHQGVVKQIVGGSLRDAGEGLQENFVSEHPPGWFAQMFRRDGLTGGHVIKLGPGNDLAAREALAAWPGGMQIGGGINVHDAAEWLDAGASHVIVTSMLFDSNGRFQPAALEQIVSKIGRKHLVIDLSCRREAGGWIVSMNRWQKNTDLRVDHGTLDQLAPYCDEFLIHAADVEGLCKGIDAELVELLGGWGKRPVTYAGGASSMADVGLIQQAGRGFIDFTIGSALDIFGGNGFLYQDLLTWNSNHPQTKPCASETDQ